MATVVVDCMCMQCTMIKGTCIMQVYNLKVIYCLRQFLLVANLCYHGNLTNCVQRRTKFDAHTHYHCQAINSNRYYLQLLTVAMATIAVYYTRVQGSMVMGRTLPCNFTLVRWLPW